MATDLDSSSSIAFKLEIAGTHRLARESICSFIPLWLEGDSVDGWTGDVVQLRQTIDPSTALADPTLQSLGLLFITAAGCCTSIDIRLDAIEASSLPHQSLMGAL